MPGRLSVAEAARDSEQRLLSPIWSSLEEVWPPSSPAQKQEALDSGVLVRTAGYQVSLGEQEADHTPVQVHGHALLSRK